MSAISDTLRTARLLRRRFNHRRERGGTRGYRLDTPKVTCFEHPSTEAELFVAMLWFENRGTWRWLSGRDRWSILFRCAPRTVGELDAICRWWQNVVLTAIISWTEVG
jgi:hypothetical protein